MPYHSLLSLPSCPDRNHNHVDIVDIIAVVFDIDVVNIIIVVVIVIVVIVVVIIHICNDVRSHTPSRQHKVEKSKCTKIHFNWSKLITKQILFLTWSDSQVYSGSSTQDHISLVWETHSSGYFYVSLRNDIFVKVSPSEWQKAFLTCKNYSTFIGCKGSFERSFYSFFRFLARSICFEFSPVECRVCGYWCSLLHRPAVTRIIKQGGENPWPSWVWRLVWTEARAGICDRSKF